MTSRACTISVWGEGYALILDFGCFHTLPGDQRPAYITGVSQAAAPGATLLLYGFKRPPKAAPMHAGLNVDEVQQGFGRAGWRLLNAGRIPTEMISARVRRTSDRFELWRYQLHRTAA